MTVKADDALFKRNFIAVSLENQYYYELTNAKEYSWDSFRVYDYVPNMMIMHKRTVINLYLSNAINETRVNGQHLIAMCSLYQLPIWIKMKVKDSFGGYKTRSRVTKYACTTIDSKNGCETTYSIKFEDVYAVEPWNFPESEAI